MNCLLDNLPGSYIDMDGPGNPDSNCIGFLLNMVGAGPDIYNPGIFNLAELSQRGIVPAENGNKPVGLGVFLREDPGPSDIIIHLAYIRPDDPDAVLQRDGAHENGRFVRSLTRQEFYARYGQGLHVMELSRI